MFAYCNNNPVNVTDPTGEWGHIVVGGILGATIGALSQIACNIIDNGLAACGRIPAETGKKSVFDGVGRATFLGFLGGAATAMFPRANCAISATMSAGASIISDTQANKSLGVIVVNAVVSAGFGAATSSEPTFSNPNILTNTFRAIRNIMPGNHPVVKSTANRFLRKTGKAVLNDLTSGVVDGVFVNYVSLFTAWISNVRLGLLS